MNIFISTARDNTERLVASLFWYGNMLGKKSLAGSDGTVYRLQAARSGVQILAMTRYFALLQTSIPALWPTKPPVRWATETLSQGIKWQEFVVDHSSPSTVESKNKWSSTPPYAFIACTMTTLACKLRKCIASSINCLFVTNPFCV